MQGLWIGPNTCVIMTEPHTLKWESYFQAPAFVCVHTYVDGHTQCTCVTVSSESWCIWPSYLLRGCPRSTILPLWPNHSLYKSFLSTYYVQGTFFFSFVLWIQEWTIQRVAGFSYFPVSLNPGPALYYYGPFIHSSLYLENLLFRSICLLTWLCDQINMYINRHLRSQIWEAGSTYAEH